MKRKTPDSAPSIPMKPPLEPKAKETPSSKRVKVTHSSELKKVEPGRKEIKLKGKGLLRLKIKEQKIRLSQRLQENERLKKQLMGAQKYRADFEHVLNTIDRSWMLLETQLRGVLAVSSKSGNIQQSIPNLPSIQNTTIAELLQELSKMGFQRQEGEWGEKKSGESNGFLGWTKERDASMQGRIQWTVKLLDQILTVFNSQSASTAKLREQLESKSGLAEAALEPAKRAAEAVERHKLEVAKLTNEIAQLQNKSNLIQEKLTDATGRISWLEEENYQIVQLYNYLVRNYSYLCEQNTQSPAEKKKQKKDKNTNVRNEDVPIEVKDKQLKLRLEEIEELRSEVVKLENNLNFIKREKTELKAQVDALISLCYGRESEAMEMVQAREAQSLALIQSRKKHKEEVDRLQKDQEELRQRLEKQVEVAQLEASQSRALMHRHLTQLERLGDVSKYKELVKVFEEQNKDLSKELEKLRVENAKLYEQFGTKKLREENRRLRVKVDQLETDILKKSYEALPTDAKALSKKFVEEISAVKKVKNQDSLNAQETIQLLSQQVNKSAKAVSDCQARHEQKEKKMLQRIKLITEQNTNLVNQSATWNVRLKRTNEEKAQLLTKIGKQNEILKLQQASMQSHHQRNASIQQKLQHITNGYNVSQQTCESWKRETELSNQRVITLTIKVKAKEDLIDQYLKDVQLKTEDLRKALSDIKRLEEKQLKAKNRNAKMKKDYKQHEREVLETQIEILQGKLRCILCKTREKQVALGCSHLFCENCITSLLKSRNRKCPICRDRVTQLIKFQL